MTGSRTRLAEAIPALPAADVARAVDFYRDRLGFELVHHDGGFAIDTGDLDGNLVTFFERV